MKRENPQNICHSRFLIIGVTRCLRTHAENAHLEPYRKGLLGESEMIVKSGDLKPFVSLSVSGVVMQGAAVAESSGTPISEAAKSRN